VLVSRGCRSHDDWMRRSPSARGIAAGVAWRGGLCRGYHMACHVEGKGSHHRVPMCVG
jgi:hypothetical protein